MPFQAIYYRLPDGREPVSDYIDQLRPADQAEVDWFIDLLNGLSDQNPELGDPYTSGLKGKGYGGFRELRADCGRCHHRILFRRSRRFFILLHAFDKRGKDIPERDKALARARWEEFQTRMDSVPRGDPRAMGRDAP